MRYILALTLLKGHSPIHVISVTQLHGQLTPKLSTFARRSKSSSLSSTHDEGKRSLASALTVIFANGNRTQELAVKYAPGSPKHPGTRKAVEAKIHRNLGLIISSEEAKQVIATVTTKAETRVVYDFVDILWRGKTS